MKLLFSLLSLTATTLAADSCNPVKQSCDPNKALGASIKETSFGDSKYFAEKVSNGVSYSDDGVRFRIAKKGDNPSIASNFYMMFGKVEVVMKAAPGRGIVSSFFLQSDDLDEIDIELHGSNPKKWQSNFFTKGNTATYDRGELHDAPASLVDEYHTYTIEFTQDKVTFALDGTIMRTLESNHPQGFPQTPMRIFAGNWVGGDPSNQPGTIEWAGGLTDYSQAPFDMHVKSIIAVDYSSGSEYKYTDQSGSWSSIEAVGGKVNGRKTQAQSDFEELKAGNEVTGAPSLEAVGGNLNEHKTQVQSDFENLKNGKRVGGASSFEDSTLEDSSLEDSPSILSSILGKSNSSKFDLFSTPAIKNDSESSDSKDVASRKNVTRTSKDAGTSNSTTSDNRPVPVTTSTSTKTPAATVAQEGSGSAPSINSCFCIISVLTFIGYFV